MTPKQAANEEIVAHCAIRLALWMGCLFTPANYTWSTPLMYPQNADNSVGRCQSCFAITWRYMSVFWLLSFDYVASIYCVLK